MQESAALIVVAAFIGFAVGYLASPAANSPDSSGQYHLAGIACNEVRTLLPALMENRLDGAKAMQIRQHVIECPECGRLMQQMRASQSAANAANTPPRLALASLFLTAPRGDEL